MQTKFLNKIDRTQLHGVALLGSELCSGKNSEPTRYPFKATEPERSKPVLKELILTLALLRGHFSPEGCNLVEYANDHKLHSFYSVKVCNYDRP